jgi:hypothetical protein
MFNKFRIGAAGVALVAAMGIAGTANAATGSANATATIQDSLQIFADSDLAFGTLTAGGAGTVAITPAGGVTCSALITCAGTQNAAAMHVTGNTGANVVLSLPTTSTSLTGPGGSTPMSVTGLSLSSANGTLTTGSYAFTVGGTLNVANGQQPGSYTGQFNVTVAYQ